MLLLYLNPVPSIFNRPFLCNSAQQEKMITALLHAASIITMQHAVESLQAHNRYSRIDQA
jgi:hypothetical protein